MRANTEYLTTFELAKRWKLSPWTIREYARRGLIVGVTRAGRGYRFTSDATLRSCGAITPRAAKEQNTSMFEHFARELRAIART